MGSSKSKYPRRIDRIQDPCFERGPSRRTCALIKSIPKLPVILSRSPSLDTMSKTPDIFPPYLAGKPPISKSARSSNPKSITDNAPP